MNEVYEKVMAFKKKYPMTVAWRLKKHCEVLAMHLDPDEKILYAFTGQKNDNPLDFTNTNAIVLTDRRLLMATKRLVFGYFVTSITPDMYNDMEVAGGLIWGTVTIDTVKEVVVLSDIQKSALPEIENTISEYMENAKGNTKQKI
jgi:hypothetical protein